MNIEDRKYILEKALDITLKATKPEDAFNPEKALALALDFEEFLTGKAQEGRMRARHLEAVQKETSHVKEEKNGYVTVDTPLGKRITHRLRELSKAEKVVLSKAIELYHAGEKVNGTSIAKSLRPSMHVTTSNHHILALVRKGYMRRSGIACTPVFTSQGNPVPVNVREVPAGYAKGYKPLHASLGEQEVLQHAAAKIN